MSSIAGSQDDWQLLTSQDPDGRALVAYALERKLEREGADKLLRTELPDLVTTARDHLHRAEYGSLTTVVTKIGLLTERSSARALWACCFVLAEALQSQREPFRRRLGLRSSKHAELARVFALIEEEASRLASGAPYPSNSVTAFVRDFWRREGLR